MALAAEAGHRVVLVLATQGEQGEPVEGVLADGDEISLSDITLRIFHRSMSSFSGRASAAEWRRLKKLKKKGKLNPEEEAKLERMNARLKNLRTEGGRSKGLKRGDTSRRNWEQKFAMLEQYEEREGHCNVPISHQEEGENLGRWLAAQREAFRQGKLDKERRQRLEELDVIWEFY